MKRTSAAAAAVLTGALTAAVPAAPAAAGTYGGVSVTPVVTTGTGVGFDTCVAPDTEVMRTWSASSYRSVGIYVGGGQRGCPDQPDLTADWVTTVLSNGWSLIPTYVDLQAPAPCNEGSKQSMSSDPQTAAAQGSADGSDAAQQLQALGIPGTVAYLDIEAFDPTRSSACTPAVHAFVQGWSTALHGAGVKAGVYVNAHQGATAVLSGWPGGTAPFDDVWVADYDGVASAKDAVLGSGWTGHSIKQYDGDSTEAWPSTGASLTIDRDAVGGDVVSGSAVSTPAGPPYAYAVSDTPNGLRERTAPSTSASTAATDANGTGLAVTCQASGEAVDGDIVWDRLTNGHYVSDPSTTTTGRNGFVSSAVIPRCDTTPPTVTLAVPPGVTTATSVTVSWTGSDGPAPSSGETRGISSASVRWRVASAQGVYSAYSTRTTTASSFAFGLAMGSTTCVAVQVRDLSGNTSAWSPTRCVARPLDDRSLTSSSGWSRVSSSRLYGGSAVVARSTGRTLTLSRTTVDRVAVVATTCTTCGSVTLLVGGKVIGTVSLHASATHYQQVHWYTGFSLRTGSVVLRTASAALVEVDGLVVTPA